MPSSLREALRYDDCQMKLLFPDVKYIGGELGEFVSTASTSISDPDKFQFKEFRAHLCVQVEKFHKQTGTFSPAVSAAIGHIKTGHPLMRIAHQPNLFAGLNILSLPIIASFASHLISNALPDAENRVSVIFVFTDYDDASDQRFRTAFLPEWSRSGNLQLTGAVSKNQRRQIACSIATPEINTVTKWVDHYKRSVKYWSAKFASLGLPSNNTNDAIDIAEYIGELTLKTYVQSRSLTEANSVLISKILNDIWGLNVLCVPASRLLSAVYDKIIAWTAADDNQRQLACVTAKTCIDKSGLDLSNFTLDFRRSGLWRICDMCLRRCSIEIARALTGTVGVWKCDHCGRQATEYLDEYSEILTDVGFIPKIVPKVMLCDLLEILEYDMRVGASYAGSIDHIVMSRLVATYLKKPVGPELIWDPREIFINTKRWPDVDSKINLTANEFSKYLYEGRFPAIFYASLVPSGNIARQFQSELALGASLRKLALFN